MTSRPIEDASRQYVELFGSALVMNTYLKIALLCVSVVAMGLLALNFRTAFKYEHMKPLVVRIDDVGRAQALQYDMLTYQPQGQAPELKYFLTQFVTKHFARMRATVKERYAESLYFLDAGLADATIARDQKTQGIEGFIGGAGDEVEVQVRNVTLDELKSAPFKATVDFDKVYYAPGQPAGAQARDVRGAGDLRAPRSDPERDGAREPARPHDHLLPGRSGLPVIANCAFLAAMVLLLSVFCADRAARVPGAVQAPDYREIPTDGWLEPWGRVLQPVLRVLSGGRILFLKDTGRKLAHVERLLRSSEPIVQELSAEIARND